MAELQDILSGLDTTKITDVEVTSHVDVLPSAVDPAHKEGRLFYDDKHKCLAYYNDQSDMAVQIGQEMVGRVYNNTGATILNGQAVRFTGAVDPVTKVGAVELAIADNYTNSRVLGVATQDIPDGSVGFVTDGGGVHGLNTLGFTQGALLYLSDTVPGGLTETPPGIRTIIGACMYSNALDGVIYTKITNNIVTPTTIGLLYDKAGTMSITTSYQNITGYTNSDSVLTLTDITTGQMTLIGDGWYRGTLNMTLSFTSSPSTRTLTLQIYNITQATSMGITTINIPKDATQSSRSFGKLFEASASDVIVLQILSTDAIDVTFDDMSFDVTNLT